MLFLVSNPRVVSLDVAAEILLGEDQAADQDKNKFKSEFRNKSTQYQIFKMSTGKIAAVLFSSPCLPVVAKFSGVVV